MEYYWTAAAVFIVMFSSAYAIISNMARGHRMEMAKKEERLRELNRELLKQQDVLSSVRHKLAATERDNKYWRSRFFEIVRPNNSKKGDTEQPEVSLWDHLTG